MQRINRKFHIIIITSNVKTDYIEYKNSFHLDIPRFPIFKDGDLGIDFKIIIYIGT